jgi:hypothetical protein
MPKLNEPTEHYVATLYKSDAEKLQKYYANRGGVSNAVRLIIRQFLIRFTNSIANEQ